MMPNAPKHAITQTQEQTTLTRKTRRDSQLHSKRSWITAGFKSLRYAASDSSLLPRSRQGAGATT